METGNLLRGWALSDGRLLEQAIPLGAEIGRWEAFKSNTNRDRRLPVVSVWVEGYGTVSARLKHCSYMRRIKDSLHEPLNGTGSVTLHDVDGDLIKNGRSIIRRNDKIKIWAGFGRHGMRHGDLVPKFTGVVREPSVNTQLKEVTLSLEDYGYLMKQSLTAGDFSAYNTPVLLVNELLDRLDLGSATWENESGLPTTFEFGNTTLSRRNFWQITHGATLGIRYVFFFDGNGDLQCKRWDTSSESAEVFRDTDIIDIKHVRMAELINEKSVDLGKAAPVPWSATAGDSLRWGQATYTKHDFTSQAQMGVSADYETEEMLTSWDTILPFGRDSVKWWKYPRQLYEMRCAAHPYLTLMDKIRIDSDENNIHGQMTILGDSGYISGSNYNQTLLLMTHRELF